MINRESSQKSSFNAISFLEELKANNIIVSASMGQIKIAVSKGEAIDPELMERVRVNKEELLTFLSTNVNPTSIENILNLKAITQCERKEGINFPLSFSQERLWFLHYLHSNSVAYHMPIVLRINGKCDKELLESTFKELVLRHETLRTTFIENEKGVFQQINNASNWSLEFIRKGVLNNHELQEYVNEIITRPFDLSSDYMFRAELIELSSREHCLVLVTHHIASDGWSISLLIRDFFEIHRAQKLQCNYVLPKLDIQYADFSAWQRKYFDEKLLNEHLVYWKQYLKGSEELKLPLDNPRPAVVSGRGDRAFFKIDNVLHNNLLALSKKEDVTLYMVLLSVFKILLYKYTGQHIIVIGTVFANRNYHKVESLIGFFANTVVLRSNINDKDNYRDYLKQIKSITLNASDKQNFPFEKLVEIGNVKRDISHNPLFQVAFLMQEVPDIFNLKLNDSSISIEQYYGKTSKFDLTFDVLNAENELQLRIEYSDDLFNSDTIERMAGHYFNLLNSIVIDSDQKIEQLSLLSNEEVQKLLSKLNGTKKIYEGFNTIIDLFEDRVTDMPNRIAVSYEGNELTYKELNNKSNQLAHFLRSEGVKEDKFIPIFMDRSLEMIVAILGILKAGGSYVPVDPSYPQERINYILKDINADITITTKNSCQFISEIFIGTIIELNIHDDLLEKYPKTNLDVQIAGNSAIYVMYTSGSTGNPKGVINEHSGILNRLLWAQEYFNFSYHDVFLQKTTYCFDVSVWEIFCPILVGGKLVLAKAGEQANPQYLKNIIKEQNITTLHFVPSMLDVFLLDIDSCSCESITRVLCSGEALKPKLANDFKKKFPLIKLYNLYGPTEAGIDVTCWDVPDNVDILSTYIGKSISNTQLYILDNSRNVVPIGIPGELFISGFQLARGYLNRPELTAQKFIDNEVSNTNPILYATGDIVALMPDWNIKYIGRVDDQVKIRGFRIELGEIEQILLQSTIVNQAAVIVKKNDEGHNQLVCFVVLKMVYDKSDLVDYLRKKLPHYMVPGIIVEVEELPVMYSGKIDKKALLEYNITYSKNDDQVLNDEIVIALTNIWEEVLGVKGINIHDNFFELGGDSIITIRIVNKIKCLGYEVQPKDIFTFQTIATLSKVIKNKSNNIVYGEQDILVGVCGLLPIQQWFFEQQQLNRHISHFNQSVILKIRKDINVEELRRALQFLANYHDSLRFVYSNTDQGWEQAYGSENDVRLVVESLSSVKNEEFKQYILEFANKYQQGLDIHRGTLFQPVLLQTSNKFSNNRLLLIIHHLAIDAVSWQILLEDLELILDKLLNKESISIIKKGSSYREWYNSLEDKYVDIGLSSQKDYWNSILQNYIKLKVDYVYNETVKIKETDHCEASISQVKTSQLLYDVSKAYHTEINDILFTSLAMVLCEWTGNDKVIIGVETHGREQLTSQVDISHTVGWFTTLYPLLLKSVPGNEYSDWIKSIKEQIRMVPNNGIGYGVLKYINKDTSLQGNDPWDIMFNYLGQVENVISSSKYFSKTEELPGININGELNASSKLVINCMVCEGTLQFNWSYSKKHYKRKTIADLCYLLVKKIEAIIDHCMIESENGTHFTPSDYGLGTDISYSELDDFLNKENRNDTIMKF